MTFNLTQKIIHAHLISGHMTPGSEIAIRIDQTLTQDATGTMVNLQFEAMACDRVQTELSVSYVDHNTLQMDFRNADDHRFLRSFANRYGLIFSPAGTGICHQLHLENFAAPGKTLIGSDSHTPTAGGLGSLAMGAGGLSVALAMAGKPYTLAMPKVCGVCLTGSLTDWASAKDIILHILGELSVKGGVGMVMEFYGPGVASLSVPERAVITNMGAELGATTSLFPSDENTKNFLTSMGRGQDYAPLAADPGAKYDQEMVVDLTALKPLVAAPHMPDKTTDIADLAGLAVDQVVIGSCTNSSYADLSTVAKILKGKQVAVDTLIAPGSKQVLTMLAEQGLLTALLASGARLLECSCGPCIGMGGAPATKAVSVRTFNRNFEGRSGTQDAEVYLASPLTAAMCALHGKFTDPETWGPGPQETKLPMHAPPARHLFIMPPKHSSFVDVVRGPNIVRLSTFSPLPEQVKACVTLKVEDNITTDHILPGGPNILALRSNIPAISKHLFSRVDTDFVARTQKAGKAVIVGGENYGQGSSREHAALGPRYLGVIIVLVKSLARIHRANLVNFGILPLLFANHKDYDLIEQGAYIKLDTENIQAGEESRLLVEGVGKIMVQNDLTKQELAIIKAGGMLNFVRS